MSNTLFRPYNRGQSLALFSAIKNRIAKCLYNFPINVWFSLSATRLTMRVERAPGWKVFKDVPAGNFRLHFYNVFVIYTVILLLYSEFILHPSYACFNIIVYYCIIVLYMSTQWIVRFLGGGAPNLVCGTEALESELGGSEWHAYIVFYYVFH